VPAGERLPGLQRPFEPAAGAVRGRKAAAAVHRRSEVCAGGHSVGHASQAGGSMMSGHSVEKIGGTSMAATSTLFDNVLVAGRTGEDLYQRIFVVSAYAGMTDLLLEHKKTGEPGVYAHFARRDSAWHEALDRVRGAMCERNAAMFIRTGSRERSEEHTSELQSRENLV